MLVRIYIFEQVEEAFYTQEMKKYLHIVEMREKEEKEAIEFLPRCEEDGDVKVIICAPKDGESLEDMPMNIVDLNNSFNVCECVGVGEDKSKDMVVAIEEKTSVRPL
jgi:hypothetical protein